MPTLNARNDVPRIGGSEGGFIGLVVALGIIILASAIVIFFLLRNQGGGGRGRGHVSNFVHAGRDGSFPSQGGFRNLNPFGRKKNANGGWVQQVDEEHDFDSESEDGIGIPLADSRRYSAQQRELPRVPTIKPLPPLSEDLSTVTLQAPGKGSVTSLRSRSRSPSPQPPPTNSRSPQFDRKATMDSIQSASSQYSNMSSGSGTKFHEHIEST